MSWIRSSCFVVAVALGGFSCAEEFQPRECPDHEPAIEVGTASACVIAVIETGFLCSEDRPHRYETSDVVLCSDSPNLSTDDIDAILEAYASGFPEPPATDLTPGVAITFEDVDPHSGGSGAEAGGEEPCAAGAQSGGGADGGQRAADCAESSSSSGSSSGGRGSRRRSSQSGPLTPTPKSSSASFDSSNADGGRSADFDGRPEHAGASGDRGRDARD